MSLRRLVPNLVIISFLALQVAAGFKLTCPPEVLPALEPLRIACAPELWPFLEYNMYNGAREAGETHHAYDLIAEHRDGTEVLLTAQDAGVSYYDLRGRAIKGLLEGDLRRTTRVLGDALRASPGIVALRLEAQPYFMERDGTVSTLPRETIVRYAVREGELIR